MKPNLRGVASAVIAACFVVSTPLLAASAPDNHLPGAHLVGDITYLSGGIGQGEAQAIKHVAKYYPLELEFLRKAKPRDEYLADVKIRIKDVHDKMVLDVTSDGPFLLAKMPTGEYTVSAEHRGRVQQRQVHVTARDHRRIVFEWQS